MKHENTPSHSDPLPEARAVPEPTHRPCYFNQLKDVLDMIKFEHTLFALPFAFLGVIAASPILPGWDKIGWILLAMVGARSAAMTFNRLVDTDIDSENPRTASRALPTGRVKRRFATLFMGLSIVAFGYAAGRLGPLPWKLAPFALVVILGYSLCKRFTSLSHLVLGLALSLAPLGAWIAISGQLELQAYSLGAGVLFWTAGFDILYALQDQDFDRSKGLHAIPARLGTRYSLYLSRIFHTLALFFWADFNLKHGSNIFPWLSWLGVMAILVREHWVLRGGRLDRLDHAFFTLNSLIGIVFFAGHLAEWIIGLP